MRRRYEEGEGSIYDKSRNDNHGSITQLSSRSLSFLVSFRDATLDAFYVVKEEQKSARIDRRARCFIISEIRCSRANAIDRVFLPGRRETVCSTKEKDITNVNIYDN